jgi:hypothetical protein
MFLTIFLAVFLAVLLASSLSQMPDELVLFPIGLLYYYMTKEGRTERVGKNLTLSAIFWREGI